MDKTNAKVLTFVTFLGFAIYLMFAFYISDGGAPEIMNHCERIVKTVEPSLEITCHIVGLRRICIEQSPPPAPNSTVIWAEFIGIGPARTGSSAIMWMLESHPQIEIGDYRLQNSTCCRGGELYFFSRDSLFRKGFNFYKGFFPLRKPNVKIAGEKTPKYSSHPLVPYRIRAMLGPKVKFIFTIRDPLEALLSLYVLRHQRVNDNETISDYFRELLKVQREYDECVQTAMEKILFLGTERPRTSIYEIIKDLEWRTALNFEESALHCWRDPDRLNWNKDTGELENLQHYIYKENLIRWHTVFSKSQVMCVWNDELRSNAVETINQVVRFLGLDPLPSNFKDVNFKADEKNKLALKKELGPLHQEMCEFLLERNRGIEELCPRLRPGEWKWCADVESTRRLQNLP